MSLKNDELYFQSIGWKEYNDTEDDSDSEDDNEEENKYEKKKKYTNGKYKIKIYGRDENGDSLTVTVENFLPYFYFKIPKDWDSSKVIILINYLKKNINNYSACNGIHDFKIIKSKDSYGFNADEEYKFVKLVFKDKRSFKAFEYFMEDHKVKVKYLFQNPTKMRLYESNIDPLLKFMHLKKLLSCSWIKIKKPLKKLKSSYCKNDYTIDEKNIFPHDNEKNGKIIILSFDIECRAEDGVSFPQADKENDNVIQIGSVFSYHGDSVPFYKNIITLKKASKVEGLEDVDIECYDNERKVLLAWTRLVQRTDPDIVTGYNINGFDFSYLHKRAIKLGILDLFCKLGRDLNEKCKFIEKVLKSSALGENILKYYELTGRVIVDLMKVIQRDSKLDSYKLDYVSSYYIKEKVKMYDRHKDYSVIYTESCYGVKEKDYIHIVYDEGFDSTTYDKKFKILSIKELTQDEINEKYEKNKDIQNYDDFEFKIPNKIFRMKIIGQIPDEIFTDNNRDMWHRLDKQKFTRFVSISKRIEKNEDNIDEEELKKPLIEQEIKKENNPIKGNIIYWSLAKDDLSPFKMFKYQNGTNEQRGIIAKYCIKDCYLVTLLMEKLKILNNNIGMANVCIVPLEYIFMRGQSVKIFSLVSKKCMEFGYLIPRIKKKYNKIESEDKEDEEVGYEGATVIEPNIGIHYEPTIVLDFASLYPRSMICMNICMSRIVLDKKYLNLSEYNYKSVVYNNKDGTTTTCIYAENKTGEKGIYPKILQELLDQRSAKKKLMKTTDDKFLKEIYDALQQAYKQTANSLYGQLGADVSPIYMKELAASTTATGRDMLQFSKQFMENDLKKLVNYSIHNKNKYYECVKELFKDSPEHKFKLKDINTNSKEEFVEYFKGKCNELLSRDYATKPKIIYGDSVTPDIPILLCRPDGKVDVKEIKDIGNDWSNYDQFKNNVDGLSNKEQDDNIVYKVWTDKGWSQIKRIIRHKTNKKIFEIITKQGYVKVTEDHSLLDKYGNQIKPEQCKIGTKLLHYDRFENFRKINSSEDIKGTINNYIDKYCKEEEYEINLYFDIEDKNNALLWYYSFKSFGFYVSLKFHDKKIFIESSKIMPENYENFDEIIEMNDLGYIDDYVYDLETDVGHFHAGVGSMIVKNTDSVFFSAKIHRLDDKIVLINRKALRVSIEIGLLAGYAISAVLPEPEEQVYEKTLWPLILKKKKKYVGNLYEEDFRVHYLKCMGIELKRRDNCPIAKIASGGIVNNILSVDGDAENMTTNAKNIAAIEFVKTIIKKILRNEFPIEKFIITKTLKSTYKNRTGQAHAVLADRITERDPGNAPNINDRIPFVYIITKKKFKRGEKILQGDKVEDPEYIKKNNLQIDLLFYITNQIMKPCLSYLELIAKNPQKIFQNYINKEINRRNGKKSIFEYVDDSNMNLDYLDDYNDNNNDNDNNKKIENINNDENNSQKRKIKEIKKKSFIIDI